MRDAQRRGEAHQVRARPGREVDRAPRPSACSSRRQRASSPSTFTPPSSSSVQASALVRATAHLCTTPWPGGGCNGLGSPSSSIRATSFTTTMTRSPCACARLPHRPAPRAASATAVRPPSRALPAGRRQPSRRHPRAPQRDGADQRKRGQEIDGRRHCAPSRYFRSMASTVAMSPGATSSSLQRILDERGSNSPPQHEVQHGADLGARHLLARHERRVDELASLQLYVRHQALLLHAREQCSDRLAREPRPPQRPRRPPPTSALARHTTSMIWICRSVSCCSFFFFIALGLGRTTGYNYKRRRRAGLGCFRSSGFPAGGRRKAAPWGTLLLAGGCVGHPAAARCGGARRAAKNNG